MKTTGPAPTALGETDTLASLTYTVRLTGVGGRGWDGDCPPALPHALTARAVAPRIKMTLIRISRSGSPYPRSRRSVALVTKPGPARTLPHGRSWIPVHP